jgi:DNA-binding MarR family transcriptional regulator/predicted N-acetyltransferase YhbS
MNAVDPRVATVRRFNRFYTAKIGVLQEGLLGGPYTLTETRVLFELAHRDGATAGELGRELGLDSGYLSRILTRFDADGLLARAPSPSDGRKSVLRLTPRGREVFAPLNARSDEMIGALLAALPDEAATRVVAAMRTIETALGGGSGRAWLLRPLRPGDLGWIVSRHGAVYAAEFGWDGTFEVLVAEIAAGIMKNFNPAREAGWIAEQDGVPVGSVFLVRESDAVAKLRLLLVEPAARGLGIGARLVDECTRFARMARYRSITLWTNSVLAAARRLYVNAGYRLVQSEPYHGFGQDLVSETWELALG